MRTKKILKQLTPTVVTHLQPVGCEQAKQSSIKKLIHISDIHIRHGDMKYSRYDIYKHVFANFIAELACLDCVINKEVAFVITGNIFHGKGKLDTPAVKLYFELMDRLLSFGNVIIICGNHEYRKEDASHPDMLDAMTMPYKNTTSQYKLIYLKYTGYYVIDHIGFGVKSISSNEPYPSPDASHVDMKIALFHANDTFTNTDLEHFNTYDYILLGSYKHQCIGQNYGYPGSFIQQDYNTYYKSHGFLLWDCVNKTVPVVVNVDNDYGMIVLKQSANTHTHTPTHTPVLTSMHIQCITNNKKTYVPLETINTPFPNKCFIKALGIKESELDVYLQTHSIVPTHVYYIQKYIDYCDHDHEHIQDTNVNGITDITDIINADTPMSNVNCPENWITYISSQCNSNPKYTNGQYTRIVELLQNVNTFLIVHPENIDANTSNELLDKTNSRNMRIQQAIDTYTTCVQSSTTLDIDASNAPNVNVVFNVLQWSYIMCYGEANYFDFSNMKGKIALLNGNNATGKSAFLDVLCIALYGEPSKHRNMYSCKQNNGKIINNKCPHDKNMCVSLSFTINDTMYEIGRTYTYTKPELQTGLKSLDTYIKDISTETTLCNTVTSVNDWIHTHIGTLDNLLMSSFITQVETHNFFHLKPEEQKQLLDNALHLDSISNFVKIIKESLLGYNDMIHSIQSHISVIKNLHTKNASIDELTTKQSTIQNTIEDLQSKIATQRESYNTLLGSIGNTCDFKDIVHMLENENISASKKLAKIKKTLDSETYRSLSTSDKVLCQQLILDGEDKYMETYTELETLHKSLIEDQIAIHKLCELDTIHNANASVSASVSLESLNNHLRALEDTKPVYQLNDTVLQKKQKQYDAWLRENTANEVCSSWLTNPDELYMCVDTKKLELNELEATYAELLKYPVVKPQFTSRPLLPEELATYVGQNAEFTQDTLDTLNSIFKNKQDELHELYKNKIVVHKTEKEYTTWLKTYKEWCVTYAAFINKSEDLPEDADADAEDTNTPTEEDELQQTITYRDSIVKKLHEKDELESELTQMNNELQQLESLPYNSECWACQQQPMRIRHTHVSTTKKNVSHVLQKTLKYLQKVQKVHDANNVELRVLVSDLDKKINELQATIKLRHMYEASVQTKTDEYTMWATTKDMWKAEKLQKTQIFILECNLTSINECIIYVQYILWKQWKQSANDTYYTIHMLKEELQEIDKFLTTYTVMSEMANEIDKENELRKKHDIWTHTYTNHTNYKKYLEITEKINSVQEKMHMHTTSQKCNTELINKVKTYNTLVSTCNALEKYILYTDSETIKKNIETCTLTLANHQHTHTSMQHIIDTQRKYESTIDVYESLHTTYAEKYELLFTLEELFIGSTTCEGYKEWIYNSHVVPQLQKHINTFLEYIDTIYLEITYSNKVFNYTIHDRGNTPNLNMVSGYQRFIIGLALRMAFAKMGATGQNIKHLFIDEGFVACDIYNLDKVNTILQCLYTYGKYESIMLMSHLDTIRSAADICIDILQEKKDDCVFSHITFMKYTISNSK